MQGKLGQPYGGFPEKLRAAVLKGQKPLDGRPGASMDPMDLDALEKTLRQRHGDNIRDVDVLSAALYPKVFDSYREFRDEFSDVSVVPTLYFLAAPQIGKEFTVEIERGKNPRRDITYRTTSRFLKVFNLRDIEDLPTPERLKTR